MFLKLRKDKPDERDHLYTPTEGELPAKMDLRKQMSAVEDQGQLGSCTANALVGNLEFLAKKVKAYNASRLFLYFNERIYIGTINEDSGANLRDGIKALKKYGSASERIWPYRISRFTTKPSDVAYADALKRTISSYERIITLNGVLACLASGSPVVFGTDWYSSWSTMEVEKSGVIPQVDEAVDTVEGGHAMLIVGYDTAKEQFIVRNSWGKSWGKGGYCYFSFSHFKYFSDLWTIRA